MGLNLVWICDDCKQFDTSMRGEEPYDFQWIARKHRQCLKGWAVRVQVDQFFDERDLRDLGYTDMWEYENRPKIVGRDG